MNMKRIFIMFVIFLSIPTLACPSLPLNWTWEKVFDDVQFSLGTNNFSLSKGESFDQFEFNKHDQSWYYGPKGNSVPLDPGKEYDLHKNNYSYGRVTIKNGILTIRPILGGGMGDSAFINKCCSISVAPAEDNSLKMNLRKDGVIFLTVNGVSNLVKELNVSGSTPGSRGITSYDLSNNHGNFNATCEGTLTPAANLNSSYNPSAISSSYDRSGGVK